MQVERTRHTEPSYFRVLLLAGLIRQETALQDAWGMWQRVCTDPEVVRLSMKLEKAKNVPLPSVAAPFQNLGQTLASMSEKQTATLLQRMGINLKGKRNEGTSTT